MCDKFEPAILEGQLCYTFDIAKMDKNKTRTGRAGGLFLLIDPNPNQLGIGQAKLGHQAAKIHINTIGQFTAFQDGAYALRTLKRMSATESFAKLSDETKGCQIHKIVECQNKKYLEKVTSECGCTPWALMTDNRGTICSPKEESCVKTQPTLDESCLVPCTGLYADVSEELFLQQLRRRFSNSTETESEDLEEQRISLMKETYNQYKHNYMKQVWFDPDKEESSKAHSS